MSENFTLLQTFWHWRPQYKFATITPPKNVCINVNFKDSSVWSISRLKIVPEKISHYYKHFDSDDRNIKRHFTTQKNVCKNVKQSTHLLRPRLGIYTWKRQGPSGPAELGVPNLEGKEWLFSIVHPPVISTLLLPWGFLILHKWTKH